MSEFIENIALRIDEQVQQIEAKRDRRTGRYLIDANEDSDDLTRWYRRIGALFRQLQLDINFSTLEALDEQIADHRLEAMTPVKLAAYNSIISMEINRRGCTEGTRVQVLFTLDNWAQATDMPNIYWMNGMAGTGKTTIAYTFAQRLKGRKLLGASFFCTRTSAECGNVGRIIPTLAYQLARYSTPFRSSLCRVLGNDRDLGSQTITTQFEELIMKPLLEVKDVVPEGLVVIIDALDECSHKGGTGLILDVLFKYAARLPLKFFVTSRPEPHIRNNIQTQSEHLRSVFVLHEIESSLVQEDIELYLREELEFMSPAHTQIKRLAELSGNLFIYAATAVRYIRADNVFWNSNSTERLAVVLDVSSKSSQKHAEIDDLYATILSSVLCNKSLEKKGKEQMQTIIWTVVCVCEPLSIETLSALTGIEDSAKTLAMLQPLYSVLYVSDRNNTVSTLHASFPDYILDQTRSLSFHCDKNANHGRLSQKCFELMESQLRFNICNLPSSFIADKEVEGLEKRIKSTISDTLMYACHYWGNHLQNSVPSELLLDLLQDFLSRKLLFWMEVLNLKHTMSIGSGTLTAARMWVMLYWGCTKGLLAINSPALKEQGVPLLAVWETGSEVYALSVSPDGTRLAVGSHDGSITLNDAHKGSAISGPIKAHSSTVNSLAFSPDGTRYISGSVGPTICIWSVHDGTLIASSQSIGHTGAVYSVAFSSDGQYIVSGSSDCSIRIWDAYNCSPVANPLREHSHEVNSVAFSPDGRYIAFGSDDHTVQVCNARDGSIAFEPCKGHTALVWAVAYSSDGACIASGSRDCTIRIWNAHDGTLLHGPFANHTGAIQSIAFSPNGFYLASASVDQSICVWNIDNGTVLGKPLIGHTAAVKSLTFSQDGSRIFSGSSDGTVRVWGIPNQTTSVPVATTQFEGHFDMVRSVTFSSDGVYIISGSSDHTIRTWKTHDGSSLANPLVKHNAPIDSAVLSPDNAYIAYSSEDRAIRICNAQDGSLVVGPCRGHTATIRSLAYSSNGSLLVSGSTDHTLRVWHATNGALVGTPLEGHTGLVYSVAISHSGEYIASGSEDTTMHIWQLQDGEYKAFKRLEHPCPVQSVSFSPDGTLIASGSECIRIRSVDDGILRVRTMVGSNALITSLAYSRDGNRIVSAGGFRRITVWNAHDGTLLAGPFSGHTGVVSSIAFSPDGKYIVSGSYDKTIRIWESMASESSVMRLDLPDLVDFQTEGSLDPALKDGFTFENDGWIKTKGSQLLFWSSLDLGLTDISPSLQKPIIITPKGPITVDFTNLLLGEHWDKCYILK
ncbi:hypothetical protein FRC11_007892 [Ceratobasidium sp. 423]|nr:hypothetical protein FRC11_007892 [Ceratobasidium sp. 423]